MKTPIISLSKQQKGKRDGWETELKSGSEGKKIPFILSRLWIGKIGPLKRKAEYNQG